MTLSNFEGKEVYFCDASIFSEPYWALSIVWSTIYVYSISSFVCTSMFWWLVAIILMGFLLFTFILWLVVGCHPCPRPPRWPRSGWCFNFTYISYVVASYLIELWLLQFVSDSYFFIVDDLCSVPLCSVVFIQECSMILYLDTFFHFVLFDV